ncbi:MAG: hypothetical protein HQL52_05620 [Magnetococcales bacterium]|nr:hypothetical protein [Magnetococcales bacterium]
MDQGAACYERILTKQPNHLNALLQLGNTCKNQLRFDQAISCFRRILQ